LIGLTENKVSGSQGSGFLSRMNKNTYKDKSTFYSFQQSHGWEGATFPPIYRQQLGTDILFTQRLYITEFGIEHSFLTKGFSPVLSEIVAAILFLYLIFRIIMHPFSSHSFTLKAIEKMY
jgi:hypothetical protein